MAPSDDDQVSTRAHGVDLGEIERTLQEHSKVRQAVVCMQRVDNEDRLTAYLVPEGISPAVSQLRTYLEEHLPAHMVPSIFVSLDALPLTASGTIDHTALPPPNPVWSAVEQNYVAPRNPVEAGIAEIWAEVLLVDRVGIHDDFLELGGDSLIGAQVVARIFERFGTEIPLESLFERGTVAEIADDFFSDTRPRGAGV